MRKTFSSLFTLICVWLLLAACSAQRGAFMSGVPGTEKHRDAIAAQSGADWDVWQTEQFFACLRGHFKHQHEEPIPGAELARHAFAECVTGLPHGNEAPAGEAHSDNPGHGDNPGTLSLSAADLLEMLRQEQERSRELERRLAEPSAQPAFRQDFNHRSAD